MKDFSILSCKTVVVMEEQRHTHTEGKNSAERDVI